MAADTEPIEILLHLPLLAEDKASSVPAAPMPRVQQGLEQKPFSSPLPAERALRVRSLQGRSGPCLRCLPAGALLPKGLHAMQHPMQQAVQCADEPVYDVVCR